MLEPAGLQSTYQDLSEATTPAADAEPRYYNSYSSVAVQAPQSLSKVYTGQPEFQLISQGESNDGTIR